MKKIFYYKNSSKIQWIALAGLSLGFSLIFLDSSGLNIALPLIQRQFEATTTEVFWIVNAYVITLAITALAGGRLGDLLGLRFIFLLGLCIFGLSSLACGASPSALFLILSRIFQGLGGAITLAISTTIIYHIFPAKSLGKAIGFFGLSSVFFNTIGPTIGGFFTQYLTWRWLFWINPMVGSLSFIIVYFSLRGLDRERDREGTFDFAGQLWLMLTLGAFVIALMQGKAWGWTSVWTLALFVSSLCFLFAFIMTERKKNHPLLNLQLFIRRNFNISLVTFFALQFILVASVLYAFFLIESLGLSPAKAGLALIPASLVSFIANPLAGNLVDQFGYKRMIIIGLLFNVIGFIWLFATAPLYSYLCFVLGLGFVYFFTPTAFIACFVMLMKEAPSHQKGMVSGIAATTRQTGGAVCVALMGAIVAFIKDHYENILSAKVMYMRALQVATFLIASVLFLTLILSFWIEKEKPKKLY